MNRVVLKSLNASSVFYRVSPWLLVWSMLIIQCSVLDQTSHVLNFWLTKNILKFLALPLEKLLADSVTSPPRFNHYFPVTRARSHSQRSQMPSLQIGKLAVVNVIQGLTSQWRDKQNLIPTPLSSLMSRTHPHLIHFLYFFTLMQHFSGFTSVMHS